MNQKMISQGGLQDVDTKAQTDIKAHDDPNNF